MSVQSVSLSNVSVGARPTHIVIYQDDSLPVVASAPAATSNVNIEYLYTKIEELQKRIVDLEAMAAKGNTPRPSPFFGATVSGPVGLEVRRLSEVSEEPLPVASIFNTLISKDSIGPLPGNIEDSTIGPLPGNLVEAEELVSEKVTAQEDEESKEEEGEQVEEGEGEEEDDEGEEEDDEGEEEGEAMELEEFTYTDKTGVTYTYYRDGDNQVYEKDDDGDLNDTPIGVWNEVKQKVLRYKTG